MKIIKSKIFWINITALAIDIIQLISGVYVIDPKIVTLIQGLLTITLRQLQGKEITLGSTTYKL